MNHALTILSAKHVHAWRALLLDGLTRFPYAFSDDVEEIAALDLEAHRVELLTHGDPKERFVLGAWAVEEPEGLDMSLDAALLCRRAVAGGRAQLPARRAREGAS